MAARPVMPPVAKLLAFGRFIQDAEAPPHGAWSGDGGVKSASAGAERLRVNNMLTASNFVGGGTAGRAADVESWRR